MSAAWSHAGGPRQIASQSMITTSSPRMRTFCGCEAAPGRRRRRPTLGAVAIREADLDDCDAIGRLLHDFNREFDEATPGPRALAERVRELLGAGETKVVLAGD